MRRILVLLAVAYMIAGLGAYVLYFSWSAPLLDAKQIEAFAFGPQKVTVRDLAIHTGEEEGRLLEGLLTQVNRAKLVRGEVRLDDNGLLLVFFRTDGLQYHLRQGSDGLVGISEGGRTYLGALSSPTLYAEMEKLGVREDWQAERP